jgi:hypothetical protein
MGRIAELRTKAQRKTSNIYDTLFTRRVSIYITALLHPLGVSANVVSAVCFLAAITACCLLGFGTTRAQILGGVACVHLVAVLDSVDGELARLTRRFSLQGLFLEDLVAYTMIPGIFLAIGGYLYHSSDLVWPLGLAVVVAVFGRNAMQVARRAILKSIATRRPVAQMDAAPSASKTGVRAFVEKHLLNYTNVWVTLTTLVVIELFARPKIPIVLYAFCFYAAAVLLKELIAIVMFAATGALDRELDHVYERARQLPSEPVSGVDLAGD